jgi:hypothetical protein
MQQFHNFTMYYLTFMCGLTCFGRFLAHHQELTTALAASGLTATLQGKTRGCYCSCKLLMMG